MELIFNLDTTPKMLREKLCGIQGVIGRLSANEHPNKWNWVDQLQELINEIDRHRPLAADGKHGDQHTATCGCSFPSPAETIARFRGLGYMWDRDHIRTPPLG